MADPARKLNPSEEDYEDTFERPQLRVIQGDGEGGGRDNRNHLHAVGDDAAQDLKQAEANPEEPEKFAEGDGRDAARQAEEADWNNPENRFYQPSEKIRTRINKWSTRRKFGVFGGGGTAIGLLIAGFFMLLPLKIPGIMSMITNETAQRVEQITERRAKLIIGRAILTKFGTNTGVVLTGKGAFSTLVASMRTSGLEKRLAAKGLTIESSGDGVKLRVNGELLDGGKTLRTDVEVLRALDGKPLTKDMINTLVKEEIPAWRWMKKAKFAKWLRIKYGIPRYGSQTDTSETDDNKKAQAFREESATQSYGMVADNAIDALDCVEASGDCVDEITGDNGNLKESDNVDEAKQSIREAGKELAKRAAIDPFKKFTETLTKTLVGKIATKAIPIIGWIDLVATFDHIAYEALNNDFFAQIPAYFRGKQYAQQYGVWSGYGDQAKLGALDPVINGVLANQLNGAEGSRASSYINGDASKGEPIKLKVNSNNPSEIKKFFDIYKGATANIPGTPGTGVTHDVLDVYYQTIGGGGIIGWVSDKIGTALATAMGFFLPESAEEWLLKVVQKALGLFLDFMGISINPLAQGAELMNNLHAGGTVSANTYCKEELGCAKLTPAQTALANEQIAIQRNEDINKKGVFYKLFSPENTKSLTSQLAFAVPTPNTANASDAGSKLASLVTTIPSRLASVVSPKTSASAYVDLYGVDPYGATAAELDQPLSQAFINGDPCPEGAEDKFNSCIADTVTAEAMNCEFDSESSECSDESAATTAPSEGLDFTVASYNILHAEHHTADSMAVGGCNGNPVPGDPTCGKTRAARQAQIITGQAGSNPAFDLLGTQETSPMQFDELKRLLPDYGSYPENGARMNNNQDGAVAMFWNKAKFTQIEAGKAPGISNTSLPITNPWVGLQTATGKKVYFMSIHYAITAFGGTDASIIKSSELTMDWVKSKATGDNIVIVGGDFNDKLGQKLSYCVYTKENVMQHAVDMAASADPSAGCSANRFGGIDHIYATPREGFSANGWTQAPKTGVYSTSSDHAPVYTSYSIAGEEPVTAGELKVASYNTLVMDRAPGLGYGGIERIGDIANFIKTQGLHIVSAQELLSGTQDTLMQSLPGYEASPNVGGDSDVVIWDSSMFKRVGFGKFTIPKLGKTRESVWVKLSSIATGKEIVVFSVHADLSSAGITTGAQNTMKAVDQAVGSSDTPVLVMGDMNSYYPPLGTANEFYKVMTGTGKFGLAVNETTNRTGYDCDTHQAGEGGHYDGKQDCGRQPVGNHRDHIYVSKNSGIVVNSWTNVATNETLKLSDHNPVIATLSIEGLTANSSTWAWPLSNNPWWTDHRADFLSPHGSTGTAWGEDNMGTSGKGPGIAADIGDPPVGTPVYAMLGGVVTSTSLCGSNDGIAIKSNSGGATIGIAYMHGQNKKFSVGQVVKAGDQIMELGQIGCNVDGAHLHVGIAYNGKYICPQDVFLAMAANQTPNLSTFVAKAEAPCGR